MVGGDGMVHLGANLVGGTATPLGLVPTGTGNDLAKAFGVPEHDVPGAVAMLLAALESEPVVIDTAIATWDEDGISRSRRIVGAVSCGFDAIVNERANAMRYPKGASRYTISILRELVRLRPIPYRIEHDGGLIDVDGVLASVANNRSFGGGMLIAPEASLTDGLLDLFIVESLGRIAFLRIYPRVFRGEHVTDPRVRLIRTRRAVVSAPGIIAYADGERLGPLPVEVVVDPGSLQFLGRIAATSRATAS